MIIIKPIFKSKDRTSGLNYRPIALLPVISKVLERIVYNRLIVLLGESISSNQYGFLPSRSTVQQMLTMMANVYEALDNKSCVDCIYLDFRKAFDSVPHNKLLLKLWKSGIVGPLWDWLHVYLSERRQCVVVNGTTSSFLKVLSGVPQGSVLGPLLFLMYINDLSTLSVPSDILLFADDSKCLQTISTTRDCSLLQDSLESALQWSKDWDLAFNTSKTNHVRFSRRSSSQPPFDYMIDG
uniref:Reverse transcriptase domain-containing protein n=1 Tax=Amphimedon queenslandica TaxID=400682 RepID=A0A1X7SQQ4_AMPQE